MFIHFVYFLYIFVYFQLSSVKASIYKIYETKSECDMILKWIVLYEWIRTTKDEKERDWNGTKSIKSRQKKRIRVNWTDRCREIFWITLLGHVRRMLFGWWFDSSSWFILSFYSRILYNKNQGFSVNLSIWLRYFFIQKKERKLERIDLD